MTGRFVGRTLMVLGVVFVLLLVWEIAQPYIEQFVTWAWY